jgi:hypothetical protein
MFERWIRAGGRPNGGGSVRMGYLIDERSCGWQRYCESKFVE